MPEWGKFEYGENETMPTEMKVWYEWLEEEAEELAHWFKQLGLHRKVVLRDLRRLSQESTADSSKRSESSTRLRLFFKEYPVLFTALRATFGLLASASRIVESAHGMMRDFHDTQVPAEFLNAKMRYKMNKDYEMKEERRKLIRQLISDDTENKGRKYKAAKHSDRKMTQQYIGEQLMILMEEYSDEKLIDLPEDVKEKAKIGNINRRCARVKEKILSGKKQAQAADRRERLEEKRGPVNVELIELAGRRAITINSRDWRMQSQREEMNLVRKMWIKGYFGKLPANDFKTELFRVIPSFETNATWQAGKTKIMKADQTETDLGLYLSKIKDNAKKISNGKANEIGDNLGLEITDSMTSDDYLKHFIRFDQSIIQEREESVATKRRTKLKAVFKHIGTEISAQKRFTSEETYARDNDFDTPDDVNFDVES